MKDNRRDFIKKSTGLAAAVSLGGLTTAFTQSGFKSKSSGLAPRPFVKDGGIKFAFLNGPTSPKVPFAKQLAVNYKFIAMRSKNCVSLVNFLILKAVNFILID